TMPERRSVGNAVIALTSNLAEDARESPRAPHAEKNHERDAPFLPQDKLKRAPTEARFARARRFQFVGEGFNAGDCLRCDRGRPRATERSRKSEGNVDSAGWRLHIFAASGGNHDILAAIYLVRDRRSVACERKRRLPQE